MSCRRAFRCGVPLPSGIGGMLAPGQVAHLPLLLLGELVEAQNACVGARAPPRLARRLARWPRGAHYRPRHGAPEMAAQERPRFDRRAPGRARRPRSTPRSSSTTCTPVGRSAQEALTGVSVVPTAVIGPLTISLGEYELTEPDGRARRARPRDRRGLRAARAHRGRALGLALPRRARRHRVRRLPDRGAARPDDARVLLRLHARRRRPPRSRAGSRRSCRRCATGSPSATSDVDLPLREAARGRDARRRPDVPRHVGVHDRRRLRAEHDDPQRVRAEHGLRHGARAR